MVDIFKPTIGSEHLYANGNDNGVRGENFITSNSLVLRSTRFPYRRLLIEKHSQTKHVLIDRRRQSSVLVFRSFRRVYCDSDHYLVVYNLVRDCK
jgi:hypothetical protein